MGTGSALPSGGFGERGRLLHLLSAARPEDHIRAGLGECLDKCDTQAGRCAGHDDDLVVERNESSTPIGHNSFADGYVDVNVAETQMANLRYRYADYMDNRRP